MAAEARAAHEARAARLDDDPSLCDLVGALLAQRGADIEFVVLFGSRARGDWSPDSDYDVLVGLRSDDGMRLIDRIGAFAALAPAQTMNVDLFPYSRSEWQRMFRERHLLLLNALDQGVALYDRGQFAALRRAFAGWRSAGAVVPWHNGWKIAEAPQADAAGAVDSVALDEQAPPFRR